MFYTKKKENELRKREDIVFEAIMDTVDKTIREVKSELMDLVFATAISAKVSTKKLADNYNIEKLTKFAKDLHTEVGVRISAEKEKVRKEIAKKIQGAKVK